MITVNIPTVHGRTRKAQLPQPRPFNTASQHQPPLTVVPINPYLERALQPIAVLRAALPPLPPPSPPLSPRRVVALPAPSGDENLPALETAAIQDTVRGLVYYAAHTDVFARQRQTIRRSHARLDLRQAAIVTRYRIGQGPSLYANRVLRRQVAPPCQRSTRFAPSPTRHLNSAADGLELDELELEMTVSRNESFVGDWIYIETDSVNNESERECGQNALADGFVGTWIHAHADADFELPSPNEQVGELTDALSAAHGFDGLHVHEITADASGLGAMPVGNPTVILPSDSNLDEASLSEHFR